MVCQSQAMRDDLQRVLGKRSPPLTVIGNPVDVEAMQARAAEASVAPPGDPAILAVGRLAAQKGFDVLIRALPDVLERHPDAVATILGEGEERHPLEALAGELGVRAAVRLPGRDANPPAQMKSATLLVSSSRYEGFANVIVEAMAVGCPVVATDCPGATREMVIERRTGWLANPDDPAALAQAILRALSADRAAVAAAATDLCRRSYGPGRIVAAYGRVLAPRADPALAAETAA